MNLPRSSGILLHITSLPGPYGIGDLGPSAYRFADFLARTGQGLWQVLPLVPTGLGHSPYASPSTFAGNPLLISPERLCERGLLRQEELPEPNAFPEQRVDFERVIPSKRQLLEQAFERFQHDGGTAIERDFEQFCREQAAWLDDYALFMALREAHEGRWTNWPRPLALREPDALEAARQEHAVAVRRHKFWQFLFERQWAALKTYCNDRGIRIFGDVPIYVAHDSADVWSHPELFYLDDDGHPTVVAGVPPDYFSETGQRWGNPIYRWELMRERGYRWWTRRLQSALRQMDIVRLDHFRGFEAYWEIPADEETALQGYWRDGPGPPFFERLEEELGALPVVAENLGTITPEVTQLMDQFGFPGMAVLQFAFDAGTPASPYLPHNFARNVVAYTGTHDNDTIAGWWRHFIEQEPAAARFARRYLNLDEASNIHWAAIRALMGSVARAVVIPMQDVLGLGSASRMNVPGQAASNWTWRLSEEQFKAADAERLRQLTETYGRAEERKETLAERATEHQPADTAS